MTDTADKVTAAGYTAEQAPPHTDPLARLFDTRAADARQVANTARDNAAWVVADAIARTFTEAATTAQTHADRTAGRTAGQPAPDVEVSRGLLQHMRQIAAAFPAVEYDAGDRPEEIAAVLAAARLVGIVAVPSTTIDPRTIRGCVPPAPPAGTVGAVLSVSDALAALRPFLEQLYTAGRAAGARDTAANA